MLTWIGLSSCLKNEKVFIKNLCQFEDSTLFEACHKTRRLNVERQNFGAKSIAIKLLSAFTTTSLTQEKNHKADIGWLTRDIEYQLFLESDSCDATKWRRFQEKLKRIATQIIAEKTVSGLRQSGLEGEKNAFHFV